MPGSSRRPKGFLFDVRVVELADEKGEFCGKLLAGVGADVIKVEPPRGNATRRIGPFYQDREDPERSLHFWHYNFGKRGVTLDITKRAGRAVLKQMAAKADVLLETHPPGYMETLGLGYEALKMVNPRLVMASITPFGQSGPYRDWKGSDLVNLALGGSVMLTGYDPTPEGEFDTEPIAPQMWQTAHVTGVQTYNAIVAALLYRESSGVGQYVDASIHRAMNANSGSDISFWVYNRKPVFRQTARYGEPRMLPENLATTKDGRHILTYLFQVQHYQAVIAMLAKHNAADDLTEEKYKDPQYLARPEVARHVNEVMRRWVSRYKYDREVWREGQAYRLHWAPIRKPEENLTDPHWRQRKTFTKVRHEDIGRTFTYNGAPWLAEECPWRVGPRAPRLGEHNEEVYVKEMGLAPERLEALKRSRVV